MIRRLGPGARELIGGSVTALSLKVLGAALAFGFDVLLARLVGASGAGLYFLALTVASVGSVGGRLGLDHTLLRFSAASAASSDWDAVAGVHRSGIGLALLGSTMVAGAAFLLSPWLAETVFEKPDLLDPIRWMSTSIPFLSLLVLHGQLLKGLGRIMESQLVQAVAVPTLSMVGLLLLAPAFGVDGAALAYVLATMTVAGIGLWLWHRAAPAPAMENPRFPRATLLSSCIPLLWVALVHLGMRWTGSVLLGIWGTAAEVGIFTVAFRTSLLVGFALFAVDTMAAPKFAALYRLEDMKGLSRTARHSVLLMTGLAAPVILLFFLAPGWVMSLFGPEFRQGAVVLTILAGGHFLNVLTGPASTLLMMSGHERALRNSTAVAAFVHVILALLLIPHMSMVGAAIAWAVGVAVMEGLAAFLVHRKLSILVLPLPTRPALEEASR